MTNPYYTAGTITSHTLARGTVMQANLDAIETAFDTLNSDLSSWATATSTTNLTIGTGDKVPVIASGHFIQVSQFVRIASSASPTNYMDGQVTAYDSGTGNCTVDVTVTNGAGTFAAWTIAVIPALSGYITDSSVGTLTNKTFNLTSNTLAGTTAQFNAALSDGDFATLAGAEALTNKTLTNPVISGSVVSATYAVVDAAGVAIDPRNGGVQSWTIGANRTPTLGTWNNGDKIRLFVTAAGFTIDWTTMAITWIGGSAPRLQASGATAITLEKIDGVILGTDDSNNNTDILFVGTGSTTGAGTGGALTPSVSLTALTGGLDTTARAGDTVYVFLGVGAAADIVFAMTTAGYTSLVDIAGAGTTVTANLGIFRKRMTSTPDTTAVAALPATIPATGSYEMIVMVFRNVDSTTPEDATTTTATATNTAIANPPSITPAFNGDLILVAGCGGHVTGVQTFSASYCSTFVSAGFNGSTQDSVTGVGIALRGPSAAYDPAALTYSGVDDAAKNGCAAATIALRRQQT